jgi:hypothetical protein
MAIPLHVFMRDLLSHNVEVALVMDNAANPQNHLRRVEAVVRQNFESPSLRTYPVWTLMSSVDNSKQSYLDLSDHSKRISRWGEPSHSGSISSRFDSVMPVKSNPEVPPVAPPRIMSPAISGSRKKGHKTAIDKSPSKDSSLTKYEERYYTKRFNVTNLRQDAPTQKDLSNAVERALQICDTTRRFQTSV